MMLPVHPTMSFSTPLHMYPFGPAHLASPAPAARPKRRQVKNACTSCQKACKKCDDARPCLRCVKYGVGEECVDSKRKERKKGIKRGPYKKRDGRGRAACALAASSSIHQPLPPATLPVLPPPPYPPHPFGRYSTHILKPSDPVHPYPYYIAPQHINRGSHVDGPVYYPVFHTPFSAQAVYSQTPDFVSQVRWN